MNRKRFSLSVSGLIYGVGGRLGNLRNFRKQTFLLVSQYTPKLYKAVSPPVSCMSYVSLVIDTNISLYGLS